MGQLLSLLERADKFASDCHAGQTRWQGTPYIEHPRRIAAVLMRYGVRDEEILAASLLHDVVEDTKATIDDIYRLFGPVVTQMVRDLTHDPTDEADKGRAAYIRGFGFAHPGACIVKLVDRIDNLADRVRDYPERAASYAMEARMLMQAIFTNVALQTARESDLVFSEAVRRASDDLSEQIDLGLGIGVDKNA